MQFLGRDRGQLVYYIDTNEATAKIKNDIDVKVQGLN
jgi:hypothetical protein